MIDGALVPCPCIASGGTFYIVHEHEQKAGAEHDHAHWPDVAAQVQLGPEGTKSTNEREKGGGGWCVCVWGGGVCGGCVCGGVKGARRSRGVA